MFSGEAILTLQFHFSCLLNKGPQKEISSQTDKYLVILSSKPYVFEDKLTKY